MMAHRAELNTRSWKAQQLTTTPIKFCTGAQGRPRFGWPGNRPPLVLMLRSLSCLVPSLNNKRASDQTVHLGRQGQTDAGILVYSRLAEKKGKKTKKNLEFSESGLDDNKVL